MSIQKLKNKSFEGSFIKEKITFDKINEIIDVVNDPSDYTAPTLTELTIEDGNEVGDVNIDGANQFLTVTVTGENAPTAKITLPSTSNTPIGTIIRGVIKTLENTGSTGQMRVFTPTDEAGTVRLNNAINNFGLYQVYTVGGGGVGDSFEFILLREDYWLLKGWNGEYGNIIAGDAIVSQQ